MAKAKKKKLKVVAAKKKGKSKKIIRKPKKLKVSPIPKNEHIITAYIILNDANALIDFYKNVFGAKEVLKMHRPDNKVAHAEIKIGDTKLMMCDEYPEMNILAPNAGSNTAISMHIYVKDVDSTVEKALKRGAKLLRPIENMFYGDRSGMIEDPAGHKWHVATHIEDVSAREIKKRMDKLFGEGSK